MPRSHAFVDGQSFQCILSHCLCASSCRVHVTPRHGGSCSTATLHMNLGNIHFAMQQYDAALRQYIQARVSACLRLAPRYPSACPLRVVFRSALARSPCVPLLRASPLNDSVLALCSALLVSGSRDPRAPLRDSALGDRVDVPRHRDGVPRAGSHRGGPRVRPSSCLPPPPLSLLNSPRVCWDAQHWQGFSSSTLLLEGAIDGTCPLLFAHPSHALPVFAAASSSRLNRVHTSSSPLRTRVQVLPTCS